MMRRVVPFLLLLLVSYLPTHGQTTNVRDSVVRANLVIIDAGTGFPLGDLADRFGIHGFAGGGWQYKSPSNIVFGLSGHYYFGNIVREDSLMANIRDENGLLIGIDGALFNPVLFEQGFDLMLHAGYISSLLAVNPNSGITFLAGLGYLQHNIQIYVDEAFLPQLDNDYKKGYDRLSSGFMVSQYIGYYLFSARNFINFRAGLEFSQAFTTGRRGITFDTLDPSDSPRLDMMINLKLSWILPIYEKPERRFY